MASGAGRPRPRTLCLASEALPPLTGAAETRAALAPLLADRGITLLDRPPDAAEEGEVAAVLIGGTGAPADRELRAVAASLDVPVIVLEASWLPGRLRLADPAPESGADGRLSRLLDTSGHRLDDDTIAAAVAGLPVPDGASLPEEHTVGGLAVAPSLPPPWDAALAPDRLPVLARHHGLAPTAAGPVLLVPGDRGAAWEALARGREVVCLGPTPFAGLGLAHHAPAPEALAPALAALADGRRNRRDAARRALATEVLFNAFPPQPAAVAAALDAALGAVGRRPRRSVSIVITSRNYRAFLGAAIASARVQTVAPREIVVVDDGSEDGSADLIANHPGIVPVLKPHGGQASAFNAGFARTTGEVVLFLDADDRLLPEAVERIGAADLRGIARVFFPLATIDAGGRATGLYAPGTPLAPAASGLLAGALAVNGIFPLVPTSGNAFPRWVLEALLPMPEADWRLCADLYLALAAATLGEAADLGTVLGEYRVHGRNGYFERLGNGLHRAAPRRAQRRRAWSSLTARPPGPLAARLRLDLHRLAVAAASAEAGEGARPPWTSALREIARGVAVAAAARGAPATARLAHALLPIAARLRRRARTGAAATARPRARRQDPILQAGPATWPRLGPGERLDLTAPPAGCGALGRGWSHPKPDGARLDAPEGTLALRLPELALDWRLRLDVAVAGARPLLGVEVELNGTCIDIVDLRRLGVIDLGLPAELLLPWREVVPEPGPGALAAAVTLRTAAADAGRLRLSALRLDPLPPAPPPAPAVPTGRRLEVAPEAAEGLPAACLVAGWGWPDAGGARLAAGRGRLDLSLAAPGPHALMLHLTGDGRDPPPRPGQLQLIVNGALIAAHWAEHAAAGCTLAAALPREAPLPDGRIQVELCAFADPETGAWPALRLAVLRLDRLEDARGAPLLSPNLAVPAGPLADAAASRAEGLAADGACARIVAVRFRLELRPAPLPRPAHLHLRLTAGEAGPVAARLALLERDFPVLLGRDNEVALELPATTPDAQHAPLVLKGHVDAPAPCLALQAVEIRAPFTAAAAPPAPDPGVWLGSAGLGPAALWACAADAAAWRPPVEDALWLALHRAELLLPPPPAATRVLAVSVLSLPGTDQRLEIAAGSSRAATTRGGLETLHLRLRAPAGGALRLTVTSSRLVAAEVVGAGGPHMLGGALCRIAALTVPAGKKAPAGATAGVPAVADVAAAERDTRVEGSGEA